MAKKKDEKKDEVVQVTPPNLVEAAFEIEGDAPYVQNKFSQKAKNAIKEAQLAGSRNTKGGKKAPKDFDACYEGALHVDKDGHYGIPATAFRQALISACRLVGYKMTIAKLSVFVHADGFDREDGTPLVRITSGKPRKVEHMVRVANGNPDIRVRPMWDEGWKARVRIRYDGDQFSLTDVTNLMLRVGMQVGVGEGRNDSKSSAGMGWGSFTLKVSKKAA